MPKPRSDRRSFRCEGCGCEMSGDDIGDRLLDAWNANHADCTKETNP